MANHHINGKSCNLAEDDNDLNGVENRANDKKIQRTHFNFDGSLWEQSRQHYLQWLCCDHDISGSGQHVIWVAGYSRAEKFRGLEFGILVWQFIMMLTFLIFPIFRVWYKIAKRTHPKKKLTGGVFILLYGAYLATIHSSTVFVCIHFDVSVVAAFAVLLQTIRLTMKSYAYIGLNVA